MLPARIECRAGGACRSRTSLEGPHLKNEFPQLPANLDAERAILGAILLVDSGTAEVDEALRLYGFTALRLYGFTAFRLLRFLLTPAPRHFSPHEAFA